MQAADVECFLNRLPSCARPSVPPPCRAQPLTSAPHSQPSSTPLWAARPPPTSSPLTPMTLTSFSVSPFLPSCAACNKDKEDSVLYTCRFHASNLPCLYCNHTCSLPTIKIACSSCASKPCLKLPPNTNEPMNATLQLASQHCLVVYTSCQTTARQLLTPCTDVLQAPSCLRMWV